MPEDFIGRIVRVRGIIEGDGAEYGAQTWFRDKMAELGFHAPVNATIHRWFKGRYNPSGDAMKALEMLESEARALLLAKIEEIGPGE